MLVFVSGSSGGGGDKESPVFTIENEHTWLVLKGGGGGVGEESVQNQCP